MSGASLRVAIAHEGELAHERLAEEFGLPEVAALAPDSVRLLAGRTELTPADLEGIQALIVLSANIPIDAGLIAGAGDLALVARWGVGFDRVDTEACGDAGIAVAITPAGPYRAVASGNVAMLLALAHRIPRKEAILRAGDWVEAGAHRGIGLSGKTLGSVGLGRIARETLRLLAPFEMRVIAFDPYIDPAQKPDGVDLVSLEELAEQSDFVVVNAALTAETRGLLGADFFSRLRQGTRLVNLARGPILDEEALIAAIDAGRIGGAALDVFAEEPLPSDSPLRSAPEAILTPHSVSITDELIRGNGAGVVDAVRAVAAGETPQALANPDALAAERFAERVARVPRQAI